LEAEEKFRCERKLSAKAMKSRKKDAKKKNFAVYEQKVHNGLTFIRQSPH
jgi:hypothetical protein